MISTSSAATIGSDWTQRDAKRRRLTTHLLQCSSPVLRSVVPGNRFNREANDPCTFALTQVEEVIVELRCEVSLGNRSRVRRDECRVEKPRYARAACSDASRRQLPCVCRSRSSTTKSTQSRYRTGPTHSAEASEFKAATDAVFATMWADHFRRANATARNKLFRRARTHECAASSSLASTGRDRRTPIARLLRCH